MRPAGILGPLDLPLILAVEAEGLPRGPSVANGRGDGGSAPTAARDAVCALLVWSVSLFLSLFVRPNYEDASTSQFVYYAFYNTGIGWFVGFHLLDRISAGGVAFFALRACAVILLGTLFNEIAVEPYVFATGPISGEGVYYGLVDALTTVTIFVLLRLAGWLYALRQQAEAGLRPSVLPARDTDADRLFVRVGSEVRRIFASDVIYMEAERDFTRIVCVSGEHFVSESLKSLLEKCGPLGLVRVHKSFAVNVGRVEGATRTGVRVGQFRVPVGRRYWQGFAEIWRASALDEREAKGEPPSTGA
jgi:DNA-binding LytR/AlgR family response regulator